MTLGLGLLPIAPILLLPFILILFVVVFPLWVVGLGVVGFLLVVVRAIDWTARLAGIRAFGGLAKAVHTAFRWVLTFGGLAEKAKTVTQAGTAENRPLT